jgi:hypothetical protein
MKILQDGIGVFMSRAVVLVSHEAGEGTKRGGGVVLNDPVCCCNPLRDRDNLGSSPAETGRGKFHVERQDSQ